MGISCNKCPHGVADKTGAIKEEFRGREYEDLPCSTCKLATVQPGVTQSNTVAYHSGFDNPNKSTWQMSYYPTVAEETKRTFSEFAAAISQFTDTEREILFRFAHPDRPRIADIARERGVSRQAVWKTLHGIFRKAGRE